MEKRPLTKLILADDDEDTLIIAKYCLEDLKDVTVKYVTSGEATVEEALKFNPDLMLIDVMMPKMDGIATLKAVRLLPSISHIPIVFFTAKVQKQELSKFVEMGAFDIITKPFDPLTFANRVLNIWDKYQEYKMKSQQNP